MSSPNNIPKPGTYLDLVYAKLGTTVHVYLVKETRGKEFRGTVIIGVFSDQGLDDPYYRVLQSGFKPIEVWKWLKLPTKTLFDDRLDLRIEDEGAFRQQKELWWGLRWACAAQIEQVRRLGGPEALGYGAPYLNSSGYQDELGRRPDWGGNTMLASVHAVSQQIH